MTALVNNGFGGFFSPTQTQATWMWNENGVVQPTILLVSNFGNSPIQGANAQAFEDFLDTNPLVVFRPTDQTFGWLSSQQNWGTDIYVTSWSTQSVNQNDFPNAYWYSIQLGGDVPTTNFFSAGPWLFVSPGQGWYKLDTDVYQYSTTLGWHNCYSFGNGVESDRIRDDFNAPQMDNGIKVSTTFLDYGEEIKGSGLIYSGLYNSTSSVNNLNEFNMSQKITKDLNPSYGSIQALKTRDTDVVVLTEDKVLKVLSNKDAVYNADGNIQLTATNRVLGTAVPFVGDYGISKNPESLAWDQYRLYFTDKQRGAVLRLSRDGLTPISNIGMKAWFRDNLKISKTILGTFDIVNGEYNVTLGYESSPSSPDDTTLSFNEGGKGWVSFKSFIPTTGVSVGGKYLTSKDNIVWEHYSDNNDAGARNNFYGVQYNSSINVVFNDLPGIVKSFKTVNYEGSQGRVNAFNQQTAVDASGLFVQSPGYTSVNDGEYYNLIAKQGWFVESITTDMQSGQILEFIEKEGKWFNKIIGNDIETYTDINIEDSTTQGLGFPTNVGDPTLQPTDPELPPDDGSGEGGWVFDPNLNVEEDDEGIPADGGEGVEVAGNGEQLVWGLFKVNDSITTAPFGVKHLSVLSGITKEPNDVITMTYSIMLREPADTLLGVENQGFVWPGGETTIQTQLGGIGEEKYIADESGTVTDAFGNVETGTVTTTDGNAGTYTYNSGSSLPQQNTIAQNQTVAIEVEAISTDGVYDDDVIISIPLEGDLPVGGAVIGIRTMNITVVSEGGDVKLDYTFNPENITTQGGGEGNLSFGQVDILGSITDMDYEYESQSQNQLLLNQEGSENPNIDGWREFLVTGEMIYQSTNYYPFN